jgi:hypothetical protein
MLTIECFRPQSRPDQPSFRIFTHSSVMLPFDFLVPWIVWGAEGWEQVFIFPLYLRSRFLSLREIPIHREPMPMLCSPVGSNLLRPLLIHCLLRSLHLHLRNLEFRLSVSWCCWLEWIFMHVYVYVSSQCGPWGQEEEEEMCSSWGRLMLSTHYVLTAYILLQYLLSSYCMYLSLAAGRPPLLSTPLLPGLSLGAECQFNMGSWSWWRVSRSRGPNLSSHLTLAALLGKSPTP